MNGPYQPGGPIPFGQNFPPPIDPSLQGSPGYAAQGPQAAGGYSQPGGIGGAGPIPAPATGAADAVAGRDRCAAAARRGADARRGTAGRFNATAPAMVASLHPGAIQAGPAPPMTPEVLQQLMQRFPQLAQHLQPFGQRPSFGLIGAHAPQPVRALLRQPQTPAGGFMQPGGPGGVLPR